VVSFFHRSLSEQVAPGPSEHAVLASYFARQPYWLGRNEPNARALTELPFQKLAAGLPEEAEAILTDLRFVEAKIAGALISDLEEDYREFASRAIGKPSDAIQRFRAFVAKQAHILAQQPWLCRQQAINEPDDSPVRTAALALFGSSGGYFDWLNRPQLANSLIRRVSAHGICGASFSPDGRRVIAGSNRDVKVWDVETGKEILTLPNYHTQQVTACAFSPDGTRIVTVGGPLPLITKGEEDRSVRLWDAHCGRHLHCLTTGAANPNAEYHDDRWRGACAFSPNGQRVIASLPYAWEGRGVAEHDLRIWDVASGESVDFGLIENVRFLAWTPDGSRILVYRYEHGGTGLTLLDSRTGQKVLALEGDTYGYTWAGACSPDGRRIIVATDNRGLRAWDSRTGALLGVLVPPGASSIQSCAFAPNGRQVAVGCANGHIEIHDAENGELVGKVDFGVQLQSCAYSPDGGRLVCAAWSDFSVWDTALICRGGEKPADADVGEISWLEFAPDGCGMATTAADRRAIHIWNTQPLALISTIPRPNIYQVGASCYSPDGERIASPGAGVWEARTGELLFRTEEVLRFLAWSPDGSSTAYCGRSDSIVVYESHEWKQIFSVKAPKLRTGRTGFSANNAVGKEWAFLRPERCAFLPDQSWIVVGGGQGLVLVHPPTSEVLVVDTPHHREDAGWAIRPDGREIALPGSTNGELWLLDLRDRSKRRSVRTSPFQASNVRLCTYSADARYVFCHGAYPTLSVWDVKSLERIAAFQCDTLSGGSSCLAVGTGGRIKLLERTLTYDLRLAGITPGPAITTAVHMFDWRTGEWKDHATARCSMCGHLFAVPSAIVESIRGIVNSAGLRAGDSPCEWLSSEAWEEPRLLGTCPSCQQPLKFNPWIVEGNAGQTTLKKAVRAPRTETWSGSDPSGLARWKSLPLWKRLITRKPGAS